MYGGMFKEGHGQIQDNFGNLQFLSNDSWYCAWIFWYYGDFNYYDF
jgi:hypothetical protein